MPFIGTKTNVELSSQKKETIKQKLGQAISIIPGKSESWLMVSFEYVPDMYFKGNGDNAMAFIEVKIFNFIYTHPPKEYLIKTTINKFRIDNGSKNAQENFIKSKEANLGKVALIQIITNISPKAFKKSQNACSK